MIIIYDSKNGFPFRFTLFVLGIMYLASVECSLASNPKFYEYPSCKKADPHLSSCLRNVLESVKGRMKYGVPEIDVPPLDPLQIPEIKLTEEDEQFLLKFVDIEVNGLSSFFIDDLRVDVARLLMEIRFIARKLSFEGVYEMRGSVFRVPLSTTGNANLTFWHVPFTVNIEAGLYEKNDRRVYLEVLKLNNTIQLPKNAYVSFDNLFNGDVKRELIIQKLLNDNWISMFNMYKYVPEIGLTELFKNITNNICSKKPYNQLLLE